MERLSAAIQNFYDAVAKIKTSQTVNLNLLQKGTACTDVINSYLKQPAFTSFVGTEGFSQLQECIPSTLLDIISNLFANNNVMEEIWSGHLLQSVYHCFQLLRVNKLLQIDSEYLFTALQCTLTSMKRLQGQKINVEIVCVLLRVLHTCLLDLPTDRLEAPLVCNLLIPYFTHSATIVQATARIAAQFLIPNLSEAEKKHFTLSSKNIRDFVAACGKDIKTLSFLQLLLAYGQLATNSVLFLKEGLFYRLLAIMFSPSSTDDEKVMAVAVVQMLSLHYRRDVETKQESSVQLEEVSVVLNPRIGFLMKQLVPTDVQDVLCQLDKQVDYFVSCLSEATDYSCLKENFDFISHLLTALEKAFDRVCHDPPFDTAGMAAMLSSIMIKLLNGFVTSNIQVLRLIIYIIRQCWDILMKLEQKHKGVLHCQQILCLNNKILLVIDSIIKNRHLSELLVKSIGCYLDIVQDIVLYGLEKDQDKHEVKKFFVKTEISKYPALKSKIQVLMCCLCDDDDSILFPQLIVEEKVVSNSVCQLTSCDDFFKLLAELKKIKCLSKVKENTASLQRHKIIEVLETLVGKYPDSEVETMSAELIYDFMSNSCSEPEEPLAKLEAFMTTCKKGGVPDAHLVGIKDLVTSSIDPQSTANVPDVILQHARYLYQVITHSYEEFQRVLYNNKLTDIFYLRRASESLEKLCIMYETYNLTGKAIEKQVLSMLTKLPELACIAFKALNDGYSTLLPDCDRGAYFNVLMPYLNYIHLLIEHWSRMSFEIQSVLVNSGAFHLLLNELHTAPTAKIITDDIVYAVLTSLYNVALKSQLAKRFRIVITKQILNHFLCKSDSEIRSITKFFRSCLYMLLSNLELSQVSITPKEAALLAQYLEGRGSFFGGFGSLTKTIRNLALVPKNRQIFFDVGLISILKNAALRKAEVPIEIFHALLNIIPDPECSQHSKATPLIDDPIKALLTADYSFMQKICNSSEEVCKGLAILLSPQFSRKPDLEDIEVLYHLKRYADCIVHCDSLMGTVSAKSSYESKKAQLYKAKSAFHVYNCELFERVEKQSCMPGFEFKEMMRKFCKDNLLHVIKALTFVKHSDKKGSDGDIVCDTEAVYMLDKALCDYLVYNTKEVSVCLLCHSKAQKLVHSHYIPKAILQDFTRALGLDSGESIYVFMPTLHPSNWQLQSAAKVTFSMLCKTCDGTVLSKDENLFKANFFSVIHKRNSCSHFEEHYVSYTQYLYNFAAGLIFRNIALRYSCICSEVGEIKELHSIMQACREVILGTPLSSEMPKIYLFALPLQLPSSLPQVYGWTKFVMMTNTPYGAYKLLRPGEPMIPKALYCFMVKIGVMIFVVSLDKGLDKELEDTCSLFEIKPPNMISDNCVMTIPGSSERSKYIPERLWWSLIGWAKLEINLMTSTTLSLKLPAKFSRKFHDDSWIKDLLKSSTPDQVSANLLPPGFELNFEKYNTLPEKVIVVPDGHEVLVHSSLLTASAAKCYIVIGKNTTPKNFPDVKPSIYSIKTQPYVLVCLQDVRKKLVVKTGFFIDDLSLEVKESLPGTPTTLKESLQLKELIVQIPKIVCDVLREKGFASLKSLMFWQETIKLKFSRSVLALDTRCVGERCNYCDLRCDICLHHVLNQKKVKKYSALGEVQCCSEACEKFLFAGIHEIFVDEVKSETEMVQQQEEIVLCGWFTSKDPQYSGLKASVQFMICQAAKHTSSMPSGVRCVKLWHRSIYKPTYIEYTIDDDMNCVDVLKCEGLVSSMGDMELNETMKELHKIVIFAGIPYHLYKHIYYSY